MANIDIKFKNCSKLNLTLFDNSTVDIFLKLLKKNLSKELPIFRDPAKYTEQYLTKLTKEVKEKLGWEWISDAYSIENTVKFHKDIENLLDKQGDFSKISGDLQNLIHEAHFCIHTIQYRKTTAPRGHFLQLEWFNDDYEELPEDAEFTTSGEFGEIILQNAYVGHPPIQCYQQNDYKNIERTCAFPDRIKPGIKIQINQTSYKDIDWKSYEKWWKENCNDFVNKVTFEKIKYYTGFNRIGIVENKEQLRKILDEPILEVEEVTVNDQVPTHL